MIGGWAGARGEGGLPRRPDPALPRKNLSYTRVRL